MADHVGVAAVVDGYRVPQHVVLGVEEDLLNHQADSVGGDDEVLRLLDGDVPGRRAVTTRTA
ncbi:hypothetical protein OH738_36490 [Streptomyces hirsutus]|uniref:hypothetical protein n=1 Tax=Streptomyces hirsutus TaxID=35620 RepID=UPI00386B27AF|nr:hypothetical protein OH738_36490 [Streptomyces hirsutus]